jgi:hypothetical protein
MTFKKIIKSADYDRRPGWFKLLNKMWYATYPLGTKIKLDKDDLIKAARKTTGYHDLGRDFWDEPFDRLLYSLNEEAALHPVGRFISRQRMINLLAIRLRAEHWFKKNPGILEQQLYPVLMIVGLQRTGTTKLHRMLAADPDNRVLLSWEAINPVPLDGEPQYVADRIRIARTSEKALKLMAPGFFAIHPVEHLAPEEDILLLDVSFLSTTPEATTRVPSYAAWLEKTDQSAAYAYAARLMKFLQWQRPGVRWVLKSPHHMEFLGVAEKEFGNVRFIWTHRDVYQSIPSFLSMVSHSQVIFSSHVVPGEVARHWVRKTGYMLSKGLQYRQSGQNEKKFSDIAYEDMLVKPVDTLTRLYGDCGLRRDGLEEIWSRADHENPKGKYGIHEYQLEDFGLSRKDIEMHTAHYQQFRRSSIHL